MDQNVPALEVSVDERQRCAVKAGMPSDAPTANEMLVGRGTAFHVSLPALDAGLRAVRILRGPWGALVRDAEIEARCFAVVDSLSALADLLVGGRVGG